MKTAKLPPLVKLDVPYKSQLDNQQNPFGSCNVTAMSMCLEFLGAKRLGEEGQFEDELYNYMLFHGLNRHSPHDLAKVVRHYKKNDSFKTDATIDEVKAWLAAGNPTVIHGYFTRFGHIVTAIGYDDTRSRLGLKNGFVVHDPYGEWFSTGYRTDKSGAFLNYSYDLISQVCIPDGQFWVHFLE